MLDLAIRGGDVADGTGAPLQRADLGIADGRIVSMGRDVGAAHRVVDASDRVVAPGFIDIHTHLDAQAFWDPTLSPTPLHGVTTVVGGNCGFSIAPLRSEQSAYLMRMLSRVEGMPLDVLESSVPWNWESTDQYFDSIEGRLSVNSGFMVGHSALRRVVMGNAANERASTSAELVQMQELLRAGLAAGGLGFSSTWSANHKDAEGQPVPSRFAEAAELVALSSVCREFEGTSLEFLPQTSSSLPLSDADFAVMVEMSKAAQRPLNWNVLRVTQGNMDVVDERLSRGQQALEMGGRVVGLVMPQAIETLLTFQSGFLLDALPDWGPTMSLPLKDRIDVLRRPEERERLARGASGDPGRRELADWGNYVIAEAFSSDTKRYEGRQVADIAHEEAKDPFDVLLDIVVADQLRTFIKRSSPLETAVDWELRAQVCRDPQMLVGGSDAGAHIDMMATHDYPTNLIANVVRRHGVMSLEESVYLLTGAPSRLYGMRDRGVLDANKPADVVIFDPDTIGATPWTSRTDLPGGALRVCSEGTGIDHVLVNGEEVVDHGSFTAARPGALLRSGRDTQNPPMVA